MAAGCLELHCALCKMPQPACRGAPAATGRGVDSPGRLASPSRAHSIPWWKCASAAPQAFPGRARQGSGVWWCFWWAWAEQFWKMDSLSDLRPQGLSSSTGTDMVEGKMGFRLHTLLLSLSGAEKGQLLSQWKWYLRTSTSTAPLLSETWVLNNANANSLISERKKPSNKSACPAHK